MRGLRELVTDGENALLVARGGRRAGRRAAPGARRPRAGRAASAKRAGASRAPARTPRSWRASSRSTRGWRREGLGRDPGLRRRDDGRRRDLIGALADLRRPRGGRRRRRLARRDRRRSRPRSRSRFASSARRTPASRPLAIAGSPRRSGELIAFCDADDVLLPRHLEALVATYDSERAAGSRPRTATGSSRAASTRRAPATRAASRGRSASGSRSWSRTSSPRCRSSRRRSPRRSGRSTRSSPSPRTGTSGCARSTPAGASRSSREPLRALPLGRRRVSRPTRSGWTSTRAPSCERPRPANDLNAEERAYLERRLCGPGPAELGRAGDEALRAAATARRRPATARPRSLCPERASAALEGARDARCAAAGRPARCARGSCGSSARSASRKGTSAERRRGRLPGRVRLHREPLPQPARRGAARGGDPRPAHPDRVAGDARPRRTARAAGGGRDREGARARPLRAPGTWTRPGRPQPSGPRARLRAAAHQVVGRRVQRTT